MYIVSGFDNLEDILRGIRKSNLEIINSIVWNYPFGIYTTRKWVTSHYHIFMVSKNPSKIKFYPFCKHPAKKRGDDGLSLNYGDRESVWKINRENWREVGKSETKLPYALIQKILEYSSDEGDLVFDPFIGSGQTAFVSKDLKRHYIGSEIDKGTYEFANKRIETGQYIIPDIDK